MKIKSILILLFFAVAIIGIIAPINAAESSVRSEDKVYSIESKNKAASLKITWNANGGKIGSKKTTVTTLKKGSKLNKLLATPKRSGYSFNGWYTQKTGGKKITKNTKPSKSVTYYAQWKKTRVLNAKEKKLVGEWHFTWDGSAVYKFNPDGTYFLVRSLRDYDAGFKGYYSIKNGELIEQYQHAKDYTGVGFNSKSLVWGDWETSKSNIEFWTKDGKEYVTISLSSYVKK